MYVFHLCFVCKAKVIKKLLSCPISLVAAETDPPRETLKRISHESVRALKLELVTLLYLAELQFNFVKKYL